MLDTMALAGILADAINLPGIVDALRVFRRRPKVLP
jgi:hypothetical protein